MRKILSKKSQIMAWCFYDWANSSYFAVVTTFIFSAYFASEVAPNHVIGTYLWGNALAISGLIIALFSPVFGAIADFGGFRKRWLFILTYFGIISSIGLWFAYPASAHLIWILACVVIGNTALEMGLTFYNAMLPNLTSIDYLGRVSGWGWGMGYFGGLSCLTIVLFVFVQGHLSWLDSASFANVRICGPFIALWLALFSLPLFLFVQDVETAKNSANDAIKKGLTKLLQTLKALPKNKNRNFLFFLISRAFYIDGLNTLFIFGGIYAATTFHMPMDEVVIFGITLNITAGIGAGLFAWFDDWFGSKMTINISLICLMITTVVILMLHNITLFWIAGAFMGLFVGPVQSASRSLLVRIVDKEMITEKFGLFSLSGKATVFLGPWLVANFTLWFNSQRIGMSVIFLFYLLGFLTLLFVQEKKGC